MQRVKTRDGWALALYRYRTPYRTSRWGPVLLVHGLGANRFNMDAPVDEISLARYLHDRGHDVWIVELRGAGRSRPANWPVRRRRLFDFDDYVQKDVPAVIRRVLDKSGSPHLHWVGHSMGGMLAYAAMIHFDHRLFKSVVTIGSPAFTGVKHPLVDQLYRLRPLLKVVRWLPYRSVGYLTAVFPEMALRSVGILGANVANMEAAHLRQYGPRILHDLPAPLLKQFAEWYGGVGGFARTDGLLGYWEHLDRIRSPLLIIAGGGDVLTPVNDLRSIFESVASTDKRFLVCSREHGFSVDYGHIDLVLGTRAREEVYPHVAGWIETHA